MEKGVDGCWYAIKARQGSDSESTQASTVARDDFRNSSGYRHHVGFPG